MPDQESFPLPDLGSNYEFCSQEALLLPETSRWLVLNSRLRSRKSPSSKPDSTEDQPCLRRYYLQATGFQIPNYDSDGTPIISSPGRCDLLRRPCEAASTLSLFPPKYELRFLGRKVKAVTQYHREHVGMVASREHIILGLMRHISVEKGLSAHAS
ncbi:hypothetical protein AVEN_81484-1 [Araneus ventricosus]|uniref:Uncharacterized protein n=1 Tax=Araneus ventricosus TaxID=182803 RepID=A0A4Y2E352_ARAVE|nr:hypothetical protein AVEN_81484-1 [Araneus ventricosus]